MIGALIISITIFSNLIGALIITITIFSNLIGALIMTITIFLNLFGALTALFFTNHCVGLKSDSEIGQLAVIGQLHLPIISSGTQFNPSITYFITITKALTTDPTKMDEFVMYFFRYFYKNRNAFVFSKIVVVMINW